MEELTKRQASWFQFMKGVPVLYQGAKLEHFPQEVRIEATRFLGGKAPGLFLTGGVGTGKTYLAIAVLKNFYQRFPQAVMWTGTFQGHDSPRWEEVWDVRASSFLRAS